MALPPSHGRVCHTSRVSLMLVVIASAGCTTVPMAPLVYGSKTIAGIDLSTGNGANPSVSISVGYKRDDLAFVPAAAVNPKTNDLQVIKGVDADKCTPPKSCAGADLDALSVFGSFEGRGIAGAGAPATSLNVMADNYFSTGIAAQKLAASVGKAVKFRQMAACVTAVKEAAALINDATNRKAVVTTGVTACTED
jgi:hypothetical protein